MTITVIGTIVGHAGLVQEHLLDGTPLPYTLPAVAYLREQPAEIPLHFDHDRSWQIGTVGWLERGEAIGLMAVATIDDDSLADMLAEHGPYWFSDSVECRPIGGLEYTRGRLRELSLVKRTANLNTRPVAWTRGDISRGTAGQPNGLSLHHRACWDRAAEHMEMARYKRAATSTEIHDLDRLGFVDELLTDPDAVRRAATRPPVKPKVATPTRSQQTTELGPTHRRVFGAAFSLS